jgi:hypothetical protein
MRITRKIRSAADGSEHRDQDIESPGIVRLGNIEALVEGIYGDLHDSYGHLTYHHLW